jgi:prophage regulatory protein
MSNAQPLVYERLPEVKARTGIRGTSTVYAMMARGEFPRPKKIGRNLVAWDRAVIDSWLESRGEATYRSPA